MKELVTFLSLSVLEGELALDFEPTTCLHVSVIMDVSDTDGDHSEEEVFCKSSIDTDVEDTPTGPQDDDIKHVSVRVDWSTDWHAIPCLRPWC